MDWMATRVEVLAQCISAAATTIPALAAAYTAWLVYGQLDAAQITLHVESQHNMYNGILAAAAQLSDTSEGLKSNDPDKLAATRRSLKVQALAFDGLIGELRDEYTARALNDAGYHWLLYQVCPPFRSIGYVYQGEILDSVQSACHDLDDYLEKHSQ